VVDASTSGAHKVSIQLGLTIVPENISKGELVAQKENRRKVRAILAGGLVLGIGAAVTLASWSDSEFAKGTFGAGHFNMQGSANGVDFSDHVSAGTAASLGFSVGFDNLSPNDTVAAPYVLRLDPATTNNAVVSVATATGTDDAAGALTYRIVQVDSFAACTPTAVGEKILVPADTALNENLAEVIDTNTISLDKSVDGILAGAQAFLCVQVTAGPTLAPKTAAVGTWKFLSESVS
jgi:predicted ribosomally synthesized peptide with SipW-like signal peptide